MRYSFIIALLVLLPVFNASASVEPRPQQIDHRVRTILYQKDQVFKYTGHYRFQSSIEFEEGEEILTISMGDSTSWMMNPSGNRLFLKPIAQDATTNMTLLTNKRSYLFELHAQETDDIDDDNMIFIMRFVYPATGGAESVSQYLDAVPEPDIENEPGKYNFNYTISGVDAIAPIRIFDDGEFTYFEFRDKNAEVPGFFMVDDDNSESLINYRTRGDYIVVEAVGPRFTLRRGNYIVCVFNEKALATQATFTRKPPQ